MRLFYLCDKGMSGVEWPDGRALLDQPVRLTEAFAIIGAAVAEARKTPR